MASTDVELEKQLKETGKILSRPPDSVDKLLPVLDRLEKLLSKVDQSPKKSMLDALKPSMKALIKDNLSNHSNIDVRVAVTVCISEITRITAPDAPYDDDMMRDVFRLIVSSFEGLADQSSLSYNRRVSILETVSKVRSCVIMLDLECDELIVEMFEHFLKTVRDYHLDSIFSLMESIMVLVLEECEEIPVEMLKPLLASVKKDHAGVLPVARKLGEGVLLKSADKLKPYLKQAIKSLGESLDMYTKVVTAVCEGTTDSFKKNDENTSGLQPANESKLEKTDIDVVKGEACPGEEVGPTVNRSTKPVMSNGVNVAGNEEATVDQESKKPEEDTSQVDLNKEEPTSGRAESQTELSSEKVGSKSDTVVNSSEPSDSSHVEGEKENEKDNDEKESGNEKDRGGKESENAKDDDVKASENEKKRVLQEDEIASPSNDGLPPDETVLKNVGRTKKKGLTREDTPEAQKGAGKKTASGDGEVTSGSDAKPSKKSKTKSKSRSTIRTGRKSKQSNGKESKQMGKKADIEGEGEESDSYDKPLKTSVKKGEKSKNTVEEEVESDSENKPLKPSAKKSSSSKNKENGKKRGTDKDQAKSPSGDDEVDSSPKSPTKPASSVKRKRTPDKDIVKYDESLVGTKVKVWWPEDKMYYEGVVAEFYPAKKKHKVSYVDGDEETLNMKTQKWEVLQEFSQDQTTDPAPSQEKTKDSSKRAGGTRSKNKNPDAKSTPQKPTGKSSDAAATTSKEAGKSKEDEETPKPGTKTKMVNKSKGKTPPSGGKSNTNGSVKAKSGASSVKESDDVETPESGKGKSTVTAKAGSKSGRKRKKRW